ncbi:unnamed protein product [Calypogeia fissa]
MADPLAPIPDDRPDNERPPNPDTLRRAFISGAEVMRTLGEELSLCVNLPAPMLQRQLQHLIDLQIENTRQLTGLSTQVTCMTTQQTETTRQLTALTRQVRTDSDTTQGLLMRHMILSSARDKNINARLHNSRFRRPQEQLGLMYSLVDGNVEGRMLQTGLSIPDFPRTLVEFEEIAVVLCRVILSALDIPIAGVMEHQFQSIVRNAIGLEMGRRWEDYWINNKFVIGGMLHPTV